MLDTVLCSCGSGLRQVHCCSLDTAALPEAAAQELLSPQGAEATKLFNEKKHREAEALAMKILDLAPHNRAALRVLYEIRKAEGKAKPTEILARRLAALPAENAAQGTAAQLQLAQMLVGQGRHKDAEAPAREAIKLSPRDATAHHVMGVILTETGNWRGGEIHYRRATALLEREDGMVLANLAWNLKLQGRLDEAAAMYERALLIKPDNLRGVGGFAQVEAARGRLGRAMALLDEALASAPADRTLRLLRALMDLQAGQPDRVLARLADAPDTLLPAELAARGQALAMKNQVAEATGLYALAKRMQRERYGQRYEPEETAQKAEQFKSWFTADKVLPLPRAASDDPLRPVFLLGFPHSGSSLLEQMLARVAGFAPADGFAPISALADMVPLLAGNGAAGHGAAGHGAAGHGATYPDALSDTLIGEGQAMPRELRRRYLARLRDDGIVTGHVYVTDRGPDNHWHLGLIKLLFPEAPIIHVIRHPFDVLLGNFAHDRRLEANCGVSLMTLARHYDFTMNLIKHFRGQLTLRYMPVRYEDMVTSPLETLAELLDFIGAGPGGMPDEFSLRANEFLATPRIPTHAALQQPIHRRARYKYRAYEAVMANLFSEVRPIIQPWIDELGYAGAEA
jgi:tetratricopeptide (TPR) repeat protein